MDALSVQDPWGVSFKQAFCVPQPVLPWRAGLAHLLTTVYPPETAVSTE